MKNGKNNIKDIIPLEGILNNPDASHRDVIRHLAEKPSPSILHTYDNGEPIDYYADFVWLSLFKEKSYIHFKQGISGIFQPNTNIRFIPGFAEKGMSPDFGKVTGVLVHSHDLLVEEVIIPKVELSWFKARIYYMPITSSGMLVRIEATNRGAFQKIIRIFHMFMRMPQKPPLDIFQRAYYHSYGSLKHTVFTSAGRLLKFKYDKAGDTVFLVYDEHEPKKEKPAGKILCTIAGNPFSKNSFFSKDFLRLDKKTDMPFCSGIFHEFSLKPGETQWIKLGIQFIRFDGDGTNPYISAMSEKDAGNTAIEKVHALLYADELKHIKKSLEAYKKYPAVNLPERQYSSCVAASLDLPRGNAYNPTGEMRNPFYNFCRINAAEMYEWWNYGQHAHESIPLINAAITNPKLAGKMLMNHFDLQKPDGKIPYGVRQTGALDLEEATMPIPGWLAWNIFLWSGDNKLLRKAFYSCRKFHNWWMKNRTDGKSILCNWLTPHETVRDIKEMPVWNIIPVSELLAVDVNSFILREEEMLSAMALELGIKESHAEFKRLADKRRRLMNELMWDEKERCYFGISRVTNQKVKIKDIAVLMPLFAGVPSEKQAENIAKMIKNPQEFCTPYPVPTLAVSDKDFGRNVAPPECGKGPNVQGAAPCMGDNWLELTYLVVEGLERYGYYELAANVAYRNLKMVCDTLIWTSHFREHYDSISGFGTGLYDYIWSSVASAFLLRFIYGIRPESEGLRIRPALPDEWEFANISNLHIRNSIINLNIESVKNSCYAIVNGEKTHLFADNSIFFNWKNIEKNISIEYKYSKRKQRRK